MDFITLEQFLLLRDPSTDYVTSRPLRHFSRGVMFDRHDLGNEIVQCYRLARMSFERYGAGGPPVGEQVYVLVSGHGGEAGITRYFGGVDVTHPAYFGLFCKEFDDRASLLTRATWWAEIAPCKFLRPNRDLYSINDEDLHVE